MLNRTSACLAGSMLLTLSMSMPLAQAEQASLIGTGSNPCSEFINVVDGQWSSPINAIHFHGYLSWAHGLVSGYNLYQETMDIQVDAETLKLDLVDRCRDNPEESFASQVQQLLKEYSGG